MLRHNRRINIDQVYRERVKPELKHQEAAAMERSIAAPPLRALLTSAAGKVYWYFLDAPVSCAKRHGVANSMDDAKETIIRLLGSDQKNRVAFI